MVRKEICGLRRLVTSLLKTALMALIEGNRIEEGITIPSIMCPLNETSTPYRGGCVVTSSFTKHVHVAVHDVIHPHHAVGMGTR